jgi:hypothetical protein
MSTWLRDFRLTIHGADSTLLQLDVLVPVSNSFSLQECTSRVSCVDEVSPILYLQEASRKQDSGRRSVRQYVLRPPLISFAKRVFVDPELRSEVLWLASICTGSTAMDEFHVCRLILHTVH